MSLYNLFKKMKHKSTTDTEDRQYYLKTEQISKTPFTNEYDPTVHGELLFFCKTDYHNMRSVHVYKNKDKFYRGENEAWYFGATIIDRDSKITEISKSDVIILLNEEIDHYKECLNDSIKNNQFEREASIREGLDELNAILNEL